MRHPSDQKWVFIQKIDEKKFPKIFTLLGFTKKFLNVTSMRPETRQSMEMLFAAKWNLPKAAKNAGLTNKEMKITFNEYCRLHLPTYDE